MFTTKIHTIHATEHISIGIKTNGRKAIANNAFRLDITLMPFDFIDE